MQWPEEYISTLNILKSEVFRYYWIEQNVIIGQLYQNASSFLKFNNFYNTFNVTKDQTWLNNGDNTK